MSIELRHISLGFEGEAGVRDISLPIESGEFLALVGPSGAGKTTLLRLIAGLLQPQTGQILINGRDVTHAPAKERNIGFVFQNYALFRHMSVADNIAFGLTVLPRSRRPSRAVIGRRVEELLHLVQVPELAGRMPDQLSGGQKQRIALARALATEPQTLLLDEPFGALDPLVRKDIRTWLRGVHRQLGLTSIFVTHDQGEAMEMADRVAVLRAGQLQQIDSPQHLEAHPETAFVHRFLGETVTFTAESRGSHLSLPELPHHPPLATALPDGKALLSVRPYHIRLTEGQLARVEDIALAGPFTRVVLSLQGRMVDVLLPPGAEVPERGSIHGLDVSLGHHFPDNHSADKLHIRTGTANLLHNFAEAA
ncbi:sulfate/molybdate ABC transporter ATP-binding protein [Granulibacter bethesdensis]|uniref:sulfate/molybdate ABC transporter ATP-binding protein n=1 Tax=Granulibacter bethesdensis TaxID=364410 RepID=UPI00090B2B23|nr:ATP-binding cassette domain-containing protein [Granulibacter bethesdensis]APH52660.1 Sulfate transport ATP-binding protein cysA [Granulibacter bethesdensis]